MASLISSKKVHGVNLPQVQDSAFPFVDLLVIPLYSIPQPVQLINDDVKKYKT